MGASKGRMGHPGTVKITGLTGSRGHGTVGQNKGKTLILGLFCLPLPAPALPCKIYPVPCNNEK